MKPTFEPIEDGLEIIDPIERHRYRLTTHTAVDPTPVDCEQIQYPIDAAVEITTDMLTLPSKNTIYVRDEEGTLIAEVQPNEQRHFTLGKYTLDLSMSLKVYAKLKGSAYIYSDEKHTYIALSESTETTIGARSFHTRPAETIKTSPEPADVMKSVSAFGSALKTTTAERSYPTLRGHPPTLKLGDELNIPNSIEQPQSEAHIEVPPMLSDIFVITPLAYYLGARVVSGPEPRLTTKFGYSHTLDSKEMGGFEATVERVLKQIFFLDCIVRTEGMTPLPLHEREVVEPILEFDVGSTYNEALAEQLETYLEIPFEQLQPYLPEWQLETILTPSEDMIEFLPFIANDLAIVTIEENGEESIRTRTPQTQAIDEFTRTNFVRSGNTTRVTGTSPRPKKKPTIPTIRQLWNRTNSSPIISTTPLSAFHNSIKRTPREDPIAIDVICNDSKMREEIEAINGVYGDHDELPFDVTVHYELPKQDLVDVLQKNSDFCHYIGHIDVDGFQCIDGKLDMSSVNTVGTKAFLLNACQSFDQGLYLIEAGSIGGIVTQGDVVNSGAISIGCMIARLLNRGFPLYAALDIARKENIVGEQYHIVGDGFTTIAQSETRGPTVCLMENDDDEISIELLTYIGTENGKGSLFRPYLEPANSYYLIPGKSDQIQVTETQLDEFFSQEDVPILANGTVQWSGYRTAGDD